MNPGSAWPVLQHPMMLLSICETFILSLLSSGVVPNDSARNAKSRNSIEHTIAGYVKGTCWDNNIFFDHNINTSFAYQLVAH